MVKDFEHPWFMQDKSDYEMLTLFFEENIDKLQTKRVVIFGAGIRGGVFGNSLTKMGVEDYDYCDNDERKWNGCVGKHRIVSPKELEENLEKYIVLISLESKALVSEIEKQLIKMGFEKGKNLYSLPSEIYDNYLKEFFIPIKDHVLMLGDCRFTFISVDDNNSQTLDSILRERFEEKGIPAKVLSMHSLCMRAVYHVLKTQIVIGNVPETLFLPINYDTYNGTIHLVSSSQHSELIRRIYEQSGLEDEEFKEYVEITKDRTENPPFIFSVETEGSSEVVSEKKLRLFLKMSYMYEPDMANEGIVYLKKTLQIARKHNIRIIVYVPPINCESGKTYWGEKFVEAYRNGVGVFKSIATEYGAEFLDQSFLLTEEGFYSKFDKNEIANLKGRIQMADSFFDFLVRK